MATPPMIYQPYQGYGSAHPFLWYCDAACPKRLRTRSDWRYPSSPPSAEVYDWRPYTPWKRWAKDSAASVYEKQRTHRVFRRRARLAIWRELGGDEGVSHHFIAVGDYLD